MKGVGNAVMYRSKNDIDRLVQELFKKLKNEHEKNLKGLDIARMYFKVFEYELAKQFVTSFLSVNENSPEGRRLLGHCYDKLGNKEKAISEYQKSLASTPNQPELLLSCCELMIDPSVKLNEVQAEKICKLTENLYPYHPTVYKLKERLLTLNGNCDPSKVENLLNAEISVRPDDMNLRIKQLKLFESSGRLSDAYSYAINIEKTCKFQKDNVEWYEAVSQICETYETSNAVNWEFYSRVLPIYEHTITLLIETKSSKQNSLSDCYKGLFRLDQALYKAVQLSSSQTEFYRSLIQHISNQFYFHLASVIIKSTKKDNTISWYNCNQLVAPLFLMSLAPPIDKQAFESISNKEFSMEQKSNVALWELVGTRRIIESGFVLRALIAKEGDYFIDNIKILCINDWKKTNYKKMFNGPEYAKGIPTSFFIHYSLEKLVYNIPELIQYAVPKHILSFEKSRPGSLHHLVWYGIQLLENENKGCGLRLTKDTVFPVGFGCKNFNDLPLSTNSFASANIESICQIDMNTFLYATVLSVASFLDNQTQKCDPKAPQTFPSNITNQLTTPEQENWWKSMYKIYSKNVDVKYVSHLRKVAIQGLESIRLIGNHGIDVQLMVYLAKNFASQANKIMDNFLLKGGLEKRAVLYWGMALQLLERISQHGIEHQSKNTLFEFYRKSLTKEEVNELLEEGRFFLACQLMNNEQNEEAIEAFKKLHSPYASFYQAMIYKKMVKSEAETSVDNTLSETSKIFLTKIKELLNITKERLKKSPNHPLHLQLKEEILDLQMEIDFNGTTNNQPYLDNLSGEDYSDAVNISRRKMYNKFGERSFQNITSTPVKSPLNSSRRNIEEEPDVKVLNELKVIVQSQNVQCQTLGLQYYNMIDMLRSLSEKVDKLYEHFNNTKDSILDKVNELSLNISTVNSTSNMSNKPTTDSKLIERVDRLEDNLTERINAMNDIIRAREDLYNVYPENEEDFEKITFDQSSCIQNTFADQSQLSSLSFSAPQLPFSSTIPFQPFGLFNQVNQSNPTPVYSMVLNPNVNITSSDILPTGPPVSQPPLSVIIPTHHILSGNTMTSEAQPSFPFKFNSQQIINHSQPIKTHDISTTLSTTSVNPLFSLSSFKESFETSLNKSKNSATDDSYTEEHDPIPEFQPIIPLPDKIEEVTGEENDIILFEKRAKLYKYVEKEWKEKGIGTLKILRNNDTNKVRLVMRREQVHKVCANHFLYDNMELKSKGDKAVVWSANDFSDAVQVQVENLCARFKTVDDCSEFTRVFNENKQPCSQNTSLVEDSNTTDNYNESDLENKKESCLTLSSENEKSLKHELGGFTFSTPPIINEITVPKPENKTPEKSKGLFSNLSFSIPTSESETPSLKSLLKTTNSETKADSIKQSFSFNLSKSGLFSSENTPKSTEKLFSFNKTEDKPTMFTPKLDLNSSSSATSYFSTLAKNSPNIGFTSSPDFKGFPGAGSTIFNIKTNPSPHAIIKPAESVNNDSPSKPNDESEDFVPTAEFTPVVPLPEKVEVVTGEEGLNVIFDDRAKLLRYDSTTKEWKEKGIGQMKILHNAKDDYYQLLMRREIVLKVCCNQRFTADLELKPLVSSDKAMSWIGQDFSEGESKNEFLAIRFKTIQQLHAFRDKFNEVKKKIQEYEKVSSSNEVNVPINVEPDASKILPKLNDLAQFKPKPGSWTCDACYLSNDASTVKCIACYTLKPGAVVDKSPENNSTGGFSFGKNSFSSTFKFGDATMNSQPAVPFVMPTFGTSSQVSFESLSTGNVSNIFAGSNKSAQNKTLTWREESAGLVKYDSDKSNDESDEGTDDSDNESDEYDGNKSEVVNEKAQFSFSNVKIEKPTFSFGNPLKSSENQVVPESTKENSTNSVSESDIECVKMLSLTNMISETDQVTAKDLELPLSFFLYKSKPKCKGCAGCESDSDKEEEKIGTQEITSSKTDNEKEIERVKEQDEKSISLSEPNDSSVTSTNTTSSQSFISKSFLFGDKSSASIFEKTTPSVPLFGSKPMFGNFPIDSTKTDDTKSTSLFNIPSTATTSSIFGTLPAAVSFSTVGSTETENTTLSSFLKTDDNKFKTDSLFNFSPKTDSPFKFGVMSKDPKLVFGQNLFNVKDKPAGEVNPWAGNTNLNKSTDEEKNTEKREENGEEEVDNSHDPHFEPIIPLPDAIEVSTGEENESILFCERSKLFRKDGNEYKERGIGDMKILFHPERNTYRLLFRREKVFKVVCNHLITPEIKLVPMKSSNKAACWGCMNTTEDSPEPQKELLAARFKNEEIAEKFIKLFDDCISKLST